MKRLILAAAITSMTGCTSPTAPSFTCYTQPRVYVSPTGVYTVEIDHYEQLMPCPAERIQ